MQLLSWLFRLAGRIQSAYSFTLRRSTRIFRAIDLAIAAAVTPIRDSWQTVRPKTAEKIFEAHLDWTVRVITE